MPILDLLASITGEKPTPSPTSAAQTNAVLPKRKAEDELRPGVSKSVRTDSVPEKQVRPNGNSPRPFPRPTDRSISNLSNRPSPKPQPTMSKPGSNGKPSTAGLLVSSANKMSSNGSKPLPSRPAATHTTAVDPGPPKKRSYAEIMARAKANSEQRESLGKIQHKTVERTMTMKERKEMKADEVRKTKMAARKAASGRLNATPAPPRDLAKASGPRESVPYAPATARKTAPVEDKKIKKAAMATTGYTGTARPRPGAASTAKAGAGSRPSSEAPSRDRARYGGPLSSGRKRYDEEDDLDDFIEYDDEEEVEQRGPGSGRRYQYDSFDEESDMEAGLSDIEDEEQLADRQARREDLEQEALEKRLKREKEERKRKLLQATKSKTGAR